jgi:hypothetical protein
VWAGNGEIFYRQGNKMMAAGTTTQPTFSADNPKMLFEGQYVPSLQTMPNYDVSRDGQRFLMVKASEQTEAATQINVVLNWFEYEWKVDANPSSLHLLYIGSGKTIWTFDRTTNKMIEWDLQGHLLYSWGSMGRFPGGLWGVHGLSVDQDGNLYVAEVDSGRVQKFRPKAGANPAFLVAKPVYSAWK